MQLIFPGTGAGTPSQYRNVTATVLARAERGAMWLFDCGEATQHQFMRAGLKPGRLEKIFITHLHGDHIFGLPGLLVSRSMAGISSPLTVYGPPGTDEFIQTTLRLSGSLLSFPLTVTEITEGHVFDDNGMIVTALSLNHVMPCLGYRIEERDRPGLLNAEKLKAGGVPRGPWLQQLKLGKNITLADGRVIQASDYLGPAIKGRSLAIFGDTAPTPAALKLANGVDVMVHEATLEAAMAEKANGRGHSTTQQAAIIASLAGAKRLIVTHISSRYVAADMPRLLNECRAIFPGTEMAFDFAVFDIPLPSVSQRV